MNDSFIIPNEVKDREIIPSEGVACYTPDRDLRVILYFAKFSHGDILEIGCNEGGTTHQLARISRERMVYGLDWYGEPTMCSDQRPEQITKETVGKVVRELPNVVILNQNSRLLNYARFPRPIGVVFIDGDHTYDGVKNDSEKAIEYLSTLPALMRRVVIWHDYAPLKFRDLHPAWLQVGDYLRGEHGDKPIIHFEGTAVAVMVFGPWPEDIFYYAKLPKLNRPIEW